MANLKYRDPTSGAWVPLAGAPGPQGPAGPPGADGAGGSPLLAGGAVGAGATPATAAESSVAIGSGSSASAGGIAIGNDVSAGSTDQIVIGNTRGQVVFPGPVVFNQGGENLVMSWRNILTANGLQGGGDLSDDRTLSPVYGTTAGTVCEGNDPRLTPAAPVDVTTKVNGYSGTGTPVLTAGISLWRGTQAEYNGITTKDPNTLYAVIA